MPNSQESPAERELESNPQTSVPAEAQSAILLPMSAEDFERRRRRVRWLLVGAAVVVIVVAASVYRRSTAPLRAREQYDAGQRLFKVARYPQAILAMDAAISDQADFADAYLLRARAWRGLSDQERAIADYTEVIRLRPNEAPPYVERGLAYLEFKDFAAARADSAKALQIDPKLALAYNLRGTVERVSNNLPKAIEDFARAVELSPDLDNYYQRGATYQLMGEHKKAIADFDNAIEFSPFSAQAYFARAESRRALGDLEGAKKDHLQGRILDGR